MPPSSTPLEADQLVHMLQADLIWLGTASASAVPNVVPVRYFGFLDASRLWMTDNFFLKTRRNLDENPTGTVSIWCEDAPLCLQLKGPLEYFDTGEEYESMKRSVHALRPDLPARGLVILTIREVFESRPGPDAGLPIWPRTAS
jgi:uncharacterized protein